MPYLALGILGGTALLIAVSYLRFRDPLYPTVIHAGIWGTVLFLYCLSAESFRPLSSQTLFILVSGIVVFAMGCYLATWRDVPQHPSRMLVFDRTRWLGTLFWLNLGLLPICFWLAWRAAASGPSQSFLVNLRILETTQSGDRFLWAYVVLLAVLSSGLHLMAIKRSAVPTGRLRFAISLAVAFGYCLLNTGRTWFFLLLIFLVGIALLTGRLKAGKALLYSALLAFSFFVLIAVLLGKGGDVNASAADNVAGIGKAFDVYLLGPLPSLDTFVRHQESMRLGDNILRSFWVAMDKLGFETHPLPLVNEFVNVPYPSNVYTIYRPYFDDFGLLGAVGIQFFLGLMHGALYRKRFASRFFLCIFAISLYPLAMQFFEDQYMSLLSLWLQTVVILFVLTREPRMGYYRLQAPTAEAAPQAP